MFVISFRIIYGHDCPPSSTLTLLWRQQSHVLDYTTLQGVTRDEVLHHFGRQHHSTTDKKSEI